MAVSLEDRLEGRKRPGDILGKVFRASGQPGQSLQKEQERAEWPKDVAGMCRGNREGEGEEVMKAFEGKGSSWGLAAAHGLPRLCNALTVLPLSAWYLGDCSTLCLFRS